MGDLEDAFLKRNVPGRYTSWSEENDDGRGADADNLGVATGDGNDDSEDDEYYLEGLPPLPTSNAFEHDRRIEPASASVSTSNGLQKSCNTGVKGVLVDYREAQQREKEEAMLKRQEEAMPRQNHHRHRHDINNNNKLNIDDDISDDENNSNPSDGDDENDGEYTKYLAKLPKETDNPHPFFRNKSQYPKVTPEDYVQLLDEMENNVHTGSVICMIVHLYESSIPECRQLHSVLKQMMMTSSGSDVTRSSSTQFIEVDALEANPDMDTIILPTILIYDRRGSLKHNLVRFTDDLPHGFNAWDLCEYFDKKLGIIV
jgi:hypothetical protein